MHVQKMTTQALQPLDIIWIYFITKFLTLMKKAKVGSKGKFVYLFVLDTAGNKKAIDAFKKSFS